MNLRMFVLLLLLSFVVGAQDFTFQLDSTTTMVLTGGWTQSDLQISQIEHFAPIIWDALKSVSVPTGVRWTLEKHFNTASSIPCENITFWGPEHVADFESALAHEMALAMFQPCLMARNDQGGSITEGYAEAKVFMAFRAKKLGLAPMTSLALNSAYSSQRYFGAGGTLPRDINGDGAYYTSAVFELFGAKLGGTFIALDQAFVNYPIPEALDGVVGQVAGLNASVWLQSIPTLFMLSKEQREYLGFTTSGDPTDGTWLVALPTGLIPGWGNSYTLVNPFSLGINLWELKSGVRSFGKGQVRYRILNLSGNELYSTTFFWGESGNDPLPWPTLADGAYPVEVCLLKDGSCDPENTLVQHFIIDTVGWTTGKMVIMTGDLTTQLKLADGQPYAFTNQSGAVTVSGLPASYTEVALTDGKSTRKFPWVPDVPSGNIFNWKMFDDPVLLSVVDAATFRFTGEVTPGAWSALWTVGATHGNPELTSLVAGEFPTVAGINQYGQTRVVFTSGGKEWFGRMNYVSSSQVNVLVPDLPAGQAIVQVELNGKRSNTRTVQVVPVQPSIFMMDFASNLGVIVHQANYWPVIPDIPALPGESLLLFGNGLGPVNAGQCTGEVKIVVGSDTQTGFCLWLGNGVYMVLFNAPHPPAGKAAGIPSLSLNLSIGGKTSNQVVLPILGF